MANGPMQGENGPGLGDNGPVLGDNGRVLGGECTPQFGRIVGLMPFFTDRLRFSEPDTAFRPQNGFDTIRASRGFVILTKRLGLFI